MTACTKCGEEPQGGDPALSNGVCCFCGYWGVPVGAERNEARRRRGFLDYSAMQPYEAALVMSANAKLKGLNPFMLRVHPSTFVNISFGCRYLHEYIDEESRSYLVIRVPERVLVCTDLKVGTGLAVLECRSPDVTIEALFAS